MELSLIFTIGGNRRAAQNNAAAWPGAKNRRTAPFCRIMPQMAKMHFESKTCRRRCDRHCR
ncbi:hypothetical protein [Chromobacterium sp.]|uniref:hypothetical protein n=1 Tax=Chromobacterium sp. TaxID=306190 RepID=UPI0035B18181